MEDLLGSITTLYKRGTKEFFHLIYGSTKLTAKSSGLNLNDGTPLIVKITFRLLKLTSLGVVE